MNAIVSILPVAYQPLAAAIIQVVGSVGVVVKGVDVVLQLAHAKWPQNKVIATLEHWFSYIAPRWPKTLLPAPPSVIGQPVSPAKPPSGMIALLFSPLLLALALAGLLLSALPAHAQVNWKNPVVYAGPTAGVETMVNFKTGAITQIGAGLCFTLTLGLGEYEWLQHSWDVVDLSAMSCGANVGTGGASGSLQLGGKVGTLNGVVGIAGLYPFENVGGVPTPGGTSEAAFGVMLDVQALIGIFSSTVNKFSHLRLRSDGTAIAPRGGFAFGG